MLNLDTHIVVRALHGSLTARERTLLSGAPWSVSAIVFWELAKLVQLGRLELDLGDPEVVRYLGGLIVWPLTLEVARAIGRLDFRGDPADEIIAATSLVHDVPLVTRDKAIRRSRVVPLAG